MIFAKFANQFKQTIWAEKWFRHTFQSAPTPWKKKQPRNNKTKRKKKRRASGLENRHKFLRKSGRNRRKVGPLTNMVSRDQQFPNVSNLFCLLSVPSNLPRALLLVERQVCCATVATKPALIRQMHKTRPRFPHPPSRR